MHHHADKLIDQQRHVYEMREGVDGTMVGGGGQWSDVCVPLLQLSPSAHPTPTERVKLSSSASRVDWAGCASSSLYCSH